MMRKFLILAPAVLALATLTACAAPPLRPETAVITSPIDEVWVAFIDVLKGSEYELTSAEPSDHSLRGEKVSTSVIGGSSDPSQRFGGSSRTQHHQVGVSMRARDEQSTAIEIRYTIDKVPDEEASFAIITAVRDRLAWERR